MLELRESVADAASVFVRIKGERIKEARVVYLTKLKKDENKRFSQFEHMNSIYLHRDAPNLANKRPR